MANMHVRDEFKGDDKVMIGNGEGLPITHIGDASLNFKGFKAQSVCTHILLKDILLVPSIAKNLLSISKLTTDNNLSVEFLRSIGFEKDSLKGKVLLQGMAEKGLYKLLLKSSPQPIYKSFLSHSQINKPLSMLSFFL